MRNYWLWSTQAGPPQFAGLGGAVEIGGESLAGSLIPYNVDSQDVRQRFWDGHDYNINDTVSHLHGNHLFQYGGSYLRIFDYHGRNDNGVGIDYVADLSGCWHEREPGSLYAPEWSSGQQCHQLSDHVQRDHGSGEPDAGDVLAQRLQSYAESASGLRVSTRASSRLMSCLVPIPGTSGRA